jgi:hypothetical protein
MVKTVNVKYRVGIWEVRSILRWGYTEARVQRGGTPYGASAIGTKKDGGCAGQRNHDSKEWVSVRPS